MDTATALVIIASFFRTPMFGLPILQKKSGLVVEFEYFLGTNSLITNIFHCFLILLVYNLGKDAVSQMKTKMGISEQEAITIGSKLIESSLIRPTTFTTLLTFHNNATKYAFEKVCKQLQFNSLHGNY